MKKINLIGWLSRNSHEKQSPQRFGRYAAMLIMLLTLGVGQMWADCQIANTNNASFYNTVTNSSLSLTNDDNNHYYGNLYVKGGTTYERKWVVGGSGWSNWYKQDRDAAPSGNYEGTVCLNTGDGNDKFTTPGTTSKYYKLYIDLWCSYDWGSKVKFYYDEVSALSPSLSGATTSMSGGSTREFSSSCTGGSGSYTYAYTCRNTTDDTDASSALSATSGTSTTFTAPVAGTAKTYRITVTATDANSQLTGLGFSSKSTHKDITVNATLTPTITLTSVTPSTSIVAGNDITLVGTRANSSNTISFQYTTNDGLTWTDITPKTTSGDSPKTITWTVPDAHGETQTFKFRAKLAEATPKYSDNSSGVSVYNTKTLKVKNTNNWSTMYLHAWNAGGALNGTDWPGKTGVGDNGLSCTNIGGGLWWEVVLTSQVTSFVLHQNVSGNANQTADLAYSSYTDNNCLAISTTTNGDGKRTLPTSTVSCLSAPSVSTSSVTPTVNNKATIGGNVTGLGNDKVTSYGYYYSSTNSSLAGNNLTGATQVEVGTNKTATGEYSKEQTSLTGGTTYYVIAYATNGHSTVYGSRVSFTTPYKVTISDPATGGTFSSTGDTYVSSTLSVTCTAAEGYTFNRWTALGCSMTSTSTTSGVTTATLTPSADNATLTAAYDEDMHTVTVTTDGHGTITTPASGTPRTVSAGIATGASIATSANTGYTFYNWTKTSGSGTVTFANANANSTTVKATSDATVQANFVDQWNLKGDQWGPDWSEYKPLTATANANEYSVSLSLTKGTKYQFKVVKRTYNGSGVGTTDAWYGNTNGAGNKAFTRGMSAFTTVAEGTNNNLEVTPDVTGTYTFTINTSGSTPTITVTYPTAYTITYGVGTINGSSTAVSVSPSFTSGDYVLPETDVTFSKGSTEAGYTWKGWYSNEEGDDDAWSITDASLSLTATRTGNISVYACYNYATYTATLSTTGRTGYGSGAPENQTATYTQAMPTITPPTATNGYCFMGYWDGEEGTGTQYYNANGTSAHAWDKTSEATLYAYFKKAEITSLTFASGTVEPSGKVTATATIEPTPTPTTIVCWKLLYNNGTEYSPQPTFTPESGNVVSFNAPEASGTYKVQAQLRTGSVCGSGTLLSESETSFVVAGTHNVTIQYKCGDVTVKSSTVVEGVKPLDWSETITPGDEPFGYTFARWEAGDGVSITDDDGASTKTTTTSSSIKIKAIYDGRLTAVYTKKNIIYFKNTLEWSDVYVNLYPDKWWSTEKGAGNNNLADDKRNKHMTQLGETDIWYYEYGNTATTAYVSFTDRSQNNYEGFAGTSGSDRVKVSYPTKPNATAAEDPNYGFNAGTPMFVPIEQTVQPWNKSGDVDLAEYYNKGYWRAYDPTTGESGSTGYTLKIYNKTEDSSRELLQSIPFTNADASGQIFKASINLEAATGYGIKVERDNSLMYTNTTGHLHQTGNVETLSVNPDNYKAIYILTTAAGDYDFIITCNESGQLCLQATFPAKSGDYRVLYTDNATWSNDAHVKETWVHPSRVISAEAGAKDIISFFVSKDNSPEYKIQKVNTINEGSGAITWTDVTSWNPISVDATGVYNFIFNQPSAGFISLSKTEAYTGNFYIRTDNAGSTKWENYRAEDHKMTYSEYAAKVSHADESMDFTHYFMKYVDKDIESGKYKNVKFTVANDYSPCISDTLVRQAGDITPNNVDANGNLQASANIRFMWNIKNNKLQRAYLSPAQTDGSKFLVLQGQATKLLAPDGTALSDENGNNHNGGTDAIQFTDKENWMYEANVKAVPGGRVKLYAVFHESTFYYYGDDDASFNDSHAIELIGGTGEAQRIRVVYDFKTDRLMAAWVPSDGDISAPQTINADIMLIREHQNAGKQINLVETGSISTDKTVYGVLRFNRWTLNNKSTTNTGTTESPVHAVLPVGEQKSQYERFNYMISFPFDVQVGEIFGFGTIGRHYRIYYYDGLGRAQEGFFAERGDDNWRMIDDTDSILHANQGYLLQLNYIRMADDNTETWPQANMNEVELYFPAMNEINIIELEDVEIPALGDAYKCKINLQPIYEAQENPKADEADRRIKDSYWRCIGVPGFTSYEANAGTWENFNWKAETEKLSYLYEWHMDDNKLSVVSSSTFTFKPMHAYLIQNGNSFTWTSVAHPIVAAPRRSAAEEGFYEFYLEMQNGEQALDHTYVRLTDKENITADFDFGQDLSKELNSGANIFTKVGYERLAANNLPLSEQTTIIPVGVTTAEEGYYTFSMPEGTHGIGVTLVDNETGDRTNLSLFDYSVNLTKGDYANRFILEISPIQQMPTNIDNVQGESAQSAKARKVMIDGILYIVKDGKVFDAQGKRLQ